MYRLVSELVSETVNGDAVDLVRESYRPWTRVSDGDKATTIIQSTAGFQSLLKNHSAVYTALGRLEGNMVGDPPPSRKQKRCSGI